MIEIAPGWTLQVDHDGDWLLVKLCNRSLSLGDKPPLAERVWMLLEQHNTYQFVLEMDELQVLYSYLIGQLVLLHKRIVVRSGVMRLSGLSSCNQEVLRIARLDDRFPPYRNREEAVLGRVAPQQDQ